MTSDGLKLAQPRRAFRPVWAAVAMLALASCVRTGDVAWTDVTRYRVTPVEGPEIPAEFRVPQIAFGGACPRDLTFYRLQVQSRDRLPEGLDGTIADILARYGSGAAAETALRSQILSLRTGIAQLANARPLDDLQRRRAVDQRLDDLSDQHLFTQAMLAAVICDAREKAASGTS